MTVAQLIAKLQALPGDKRVVLVSEVGRVSEICDAYEGFIRQEADFLQGEPNPFEWAEMLEARAEPDYVVGVLTE